MIIVRFQDEASQKRALEFLIGRFSGHSWATGEVAVPEEALAPMAREGIPFNVEGPATHERILALRDSFTTASTMEISRERRRLVGEVDSTDAAS